MNGIVWLASYPKSGNTWFRIFLSNLLRDAQEPVNINDLRESNWSNLRSLFDDYLGIKSSDLPFREIENLRPALYRQMAQESDQPIFLKTHDAYTKTSQNELLIPSDATERILYFVRNPLDVAASFAHHNVEKIDETIAKMANDSYTMWYKTDGINIQLPQLIMSWSQNVLTWLNGKSDKIRFIRYEDMVRDPFTTFSAAVDFLGIKKSPIEIERAIHFSSFDILKKQEQEAGFQEKNPKSLSFFRSGSVGNWAKELTKEQIEQIISDHADVMKMFNYL